MTSFLNNQKLFQKASHFFYYAVLGIGCFYLSFPNRLSIFGHPFFAYFFVVFLIKALQGQTLFSRLRFGFLFGWVSYLLLVNWVLPVDLFGYLIFSVALSAQVVVFSVCYRDDFSSPVVRAVYAASLWVATEYLRCCFLGGFAWTLGHSQVLLTPLVQMMDITGAYGVSFLIVLIGTCVVELLCPEGKKKGILFLLFLCVCMVFVYGHIRLQNSWTGKTFWNETVCSVQPNVPPKEKLMPENFMNILELQQNMSYACLAKGRPSLIVWPEISLADDFLHKPWAYQSVKSLSRELGVPILIGSVRTVNDRDFNSAIYISPWSDEIQTYDKQKLIPFAEYSPVQNPFWKRLFYHNSYEFSSGTTANRFVHPSPFGVAICSEEVYPSIIRDAKKNQVCFINSLLNDGWFGRKEALMMHLQAAVVHAVSFRIPIIRTSNNGITALITPWGQIGASNEMGTPKEWKMDQRSVFLFNVSCKKMKSFYSQYGDSFSVVCLLFVLIINLQKTLNRKK